MDFDNKLSDWKNEGVEPSKELQQDGFKAGYKPPASIFNWFWSKVSKAITELQGKLSSHATKNNEEHTAFTSSIVKKLDSTVYTSTDILNKIKEVDGAGSGLDADLLDGKNSTAFAESTHNHDDRYFTETEMGVKLNSKLNVTDFTGQAILDKLGGGVTGIDASTLEGHSASYFSQATHNHDSSYAGIGHNHAVVTSSANGFMNSTDKVKLDGIEVRANNYVHPDSVNTRHVSDTEKTAWNAVGNKVDKVAGKGLSSNDYTTTEKTKLENLSNYDDTSVKQSITQVASGVDALQASKVDKVEGKGLSSNDYTTVEKAKLADIADNANNYRHPSSHGADIIEESASKRFVSDAEKATWSGKADKTDIVAFNGTATLTDNIVAITVASGGKDSYSVTFTAPRNFNVAHTYRINGVVVTLTDLNNEPLDDAWKSGSLVTINVTGSKAFFKSGGGFPAGWNMKYTAEASTNITKYSPIVRQHYGSWDEGINKILDVDVLPSNYVDSVAFDPSGTYLAVGGYSSPYISIYKRSGDTFIKLPNPSVLPYNSSKSVAFDPRGNYLAASSTDSQYLYIYKRNGDTFIRLPNPSQMVTGIVNSIAFDPTGTYLAIGSIASPYIFIYKRSGDTFTKLPNLSEMPNSAVNSVAFDPTGTYLAVGSYSSPYISIYKRSGDTFTRIPNPSGTPMGNINSVAFDPSGTYLVGGGYSPSPYIYKRSGDTFTRIPNPSGTPSSDVNSIAFDPTGTYLAIGSIASPYIFIYKRSGDTFTRTPNPSGTPNSTVTSVAFDPISPYLAVGGRFSSPSNFLTIYRTQSKEIISPITKFNPSPLSWLPSGGFGFSLQDANVGEQCKVNLFPILNDY